ncbi:MAG TPA: FecR domain-containing protein [Terriglobales bacterium]|nr:FecR domain-containing protein [Terriglobales bacterium]
MLVCLILSAICLDAAQLKEARVTHVVNDVNLISAHAAPHAAAAGKSVRDGDAIRTGAASRSELISADQTIVRLGPKTTVSFSEATRTMDLGEGAMLFQIPKSAGDVKIKTDAVTTASSSATGIIERHGQFYVKVLVLEGTIRCYLTNRVGESLLVQPGQILITKPDVTALPEPADFDIAREMKTCLLVREFQPLPSQRRIESEAQKQLKLIAKGAYIPSNLVILGRGTQVTVANSPSATPSPKPLTNTGH